jgi:hypothetical protein
MLPATRLVATPTDHVRLSIPADRRFRLTLRLLLGGIGSRSQLSYEELDELQLAVETVIADRTIAGDALHVEAELDPSSVLIALGPFAPEGRPGRRVVVEQLVRRARVVRRSDGDTAGDWVELVAGKRSLGERPS